MTTTVDAELHFKIEPEVVVVLQKRVSLSLYFIMLVMVISRIFPIFRRKKIAIGEIYVKCTIKYSVIVENFQKCT